MIPRRKVEHIVRRVIAELRCRSRDDGDDLLTALLCRVYRTKGSQNQ